MDRDVYKATLIAYETSVREMIAEYNKIAHEYNASNENDKFRYMIADYQNHKPLDSFWTYTE